MNRSLQNNIAKVETTLLHVPYLLYLIPVMLHKIMRNKKYFHCIRYLKHNLAAIYTNEKYNETNST